MEMTPEQKQEFNADLFEKELTQLIDRSGLSGYVFIGDGPQNTVQLSRVKGDSSLFCLYTNLHIVLRKLEKLYLDNNGGITGGVHQ